MSTKYVLQLTCLQNKTIEKSTSKLTSWQQKDQAKYFSANLSSRIRGQMKAKLIVVRTLQKHFLLKSVKIMVNSQMMGGQMDKNTTISCGNKYIQYTVKKVGFELDCTRTNMRFFELGQK